MPAAIAIALDHGQPRNVQLKNIVTTRRLIDLNQNGTNNLRRKSQDAGKNRDKLMISLEDCIGMCGLDADEVAAIGEHEHIPDIAAAALADYLLKQAGGPGRILTMIVEDIHKALDAGHIRHAAELFMALRHFLEQHPEANPELADQSRLGPPSSDRRPRRSHRHTGGNHA
jgi:hypothetical protein